LYLPGARPVRVYAPCAPVKALATGPPGIWYATSHAPRTAAAAGPVTWPVIEPPAGSAAFTAAVTLPWVTRTGCGTVTVRRFKVVSRQFGLTTMR
jgi:hypothetical protein